MALSNYYQKKESPLKSSQADEHSFNSKFSSSVSRELQPWPSNFDKPSELYKLVLTNSQHPPLMMSNSWNLAVPFKEQRYSHTPSESIANNYTPSANDLKIKNLAQQNKFKKLKTSNDTLVSLSSTTRTAPSRSQSPMEQLRIMDDIDKEINKHIKSPSNQDLERYYYYIEKGTDLRMIASLPKNQFDSFYNLVPASFRNTSVPLVNELMEELNKEVSNEYVNSMKKSIVDYVLMNLEERKRLKIEWIPKKFNLKTIRAPVPWHDEYSQSHAWVQVNMHNVNKINSHLQDLWTNE